MQDESQEKILYRKIADALLLDLHENPVALSKHFPCIREIQEKFHCSSYTAHRALKLLNQRGVLQVHHGKRSSPVYFPRKIGGSKGMILIVFPDWNQLRGHSFWEHRRLLPRKIMPHSPAPVPPGHGCMEIRK